MTFFLHHYEPQLNKRIKGLLGVDGGDPYDIDRFLDIKLSCREQMLHAVRLKQKSKTKRKKKIVAAIYEYQADCNGEWGELSFDFETDTAEIIRLADWNTMQTKRFANRVITHLLNYENGKLPKETMIAYEP